MDAADTTPVRDRWTAPLLAQLEPLEPPAPVEQAFEWPASQQPIASLLSALPSEPLRAASVAITDPIPLSPLLPPAQQAPRSSGFDGPARL